MAECHGATGKNDNGAPPRQVPPTAAEVVAMLASIVAATVRIEGKLDKLLAEVATLPRPAGHPAPRHPGTRWHGMRSGTDYRANATSPGRGEHDSARNTGGTIERQRGAGSRARGDRDRSRTLPA